MSEMARQQVPEATLIDSIHAERKVVHEAIHIVTGPTKVQPEDCRIDRTNKNTQIALGHSVCDLLDESVYRGVKVPSRRLSCDSSDALGKGLLGHCQDTFVLKLRQLAGHL